MNTQAGVPVHAVVKDTSSFLDAVAMAMRETLALFEKTAARVTDNVLKRGNDADHELVVTLQDFDLLHQEFATLADILTQAAAKSSESWVREEGGSHPAEDLITTIQIGDLKERLMRRLGAVMADLSRSKAEHEALF